MRNGPIKCCGFGSFWEEFARLAPLREDPSEGQPPVRADSDYMASNSHFDLDNLRVIPGYTPV
jgi:hypothetical protein